MSYHRSRLGAAATGAIFPITNFETPAPAKPGAGMSFKPPAPAVSSAPVVLAPIAQRTTPPATSAPVLTAPAPPSLAVSTVESVSMQPAGMGVQDTGTGGTAPPLAPGAPQGSGLSSITPTRTQGDLAAVVVGLGILAAAWLFAGSSSR
jgi:hypothetical protein